VCSILQWWRLLAFTCYEKGAGVGGWIGLLIRGMKKEKPKSLPVFSLLHASGAAAQCSSLPGQTNDRHLHFFRSSKEIRSR